MLRMHVEIVSDRRFAPVELGWVVIGNTTHGLEDGDGLADYKWLYYPDSLAETTPTETGEVLRHRRSDGWERLVATAVADLADRRAAADRPTSFG